MNESLPCDCVRKSIGMCDGLCVTEDRRAAPEAAEPAGHLHDDGHFTWAPGRRPTTMAYAQAGWYAPFYLAAPSQAERDAVEARSQQFERAMKILSHIDKNIGTVLQEHQYHVPGGGSIAAHNLRLGIVELHKFRAALSTTTGRAAE